MFLDIVLLCYLFIVRLVRLRRVSFLFEENNFMLRGNNKGHEFQMRFKAIKGHDDPPVWVIYYNRHHTNSLAECRSYLFPSLVIEVCIRSGINTLSRWCIVLPCKIPPQSIQIHLHYLRHINTWPVRPSRTPGTQLQNTIAVVVCTFLIIKRVYRPYNTNIPITRNHQRLVSIHHKMIL